jgi:hypothetical protein
MKTLAIRSLILLISLFSARAAYSFHVLGGEVGWECLSTGEYVFFAKVYRDCSANTLPFNNEFLSIQGNPLPRSQTNATISQIVLKPDSNKWLFRQFGETLPFCSQGTPFDCSSSTASISAYAIQQFFYRSDPIQLNGTPPATGWQFWLASMPCCRPTNSTNVQYITSAPMFRAIMYPNPNSSSPNQCDDSSPRFSEVPDYLVCKGELSNLDFSAEDPELDSISYHFDKAYNNPPAAPQQVLYRNGYSYNNPTPDTNLDSNNIPATLDSSSGKLFLRVNDATVNQREYHVVVRADAWRSGNRLASTFKELPIYAYNCPNLSAQNPNSAPIIDPPFNVGPSTAVFYDTIVAGSNLGANLSVRDLDAIGTTFQNIRIELWGDRMSKDYLDPKDCPDPNDTSCATLFGITQFDTLRNRPYYSASVSWSSILNWQTSCDDLDSNNNARTYNFYFRASDNFCPVPGTAIEVIKITVVPNPLTCPSLTTSLADRSRSLNDMVLYPNPSTGLVFIDGIDQSLDYQIFDIQGKLMKQGRLAANQNQLELPESEGLYFVSLRDEEGNEKTYKLVKQ